MPSWASCSGGGATMPTVDKNQRRAGWPWLLRHWKAWEMEEQEKAKAEGLEWDSLVPPFGHGPYWVIPLYSGPELVEEGIAMRNCMPDLTDDCVAGDVRLFSVRGRSTGRRVACIGILRNHDAHSWQVFDVKGFANSPVGGAAWPRWVATWPNPTADGCGLIEQQGRTVTSPQA